MQPLAGKTAIVTGGSRGIGRAIASTFARNGANVVIAARNAEILNEATQEIRSAGGIVESHAMDLREPASPGRLVDFTVEKFGGVSIVVNNAGATRRGEFVNLTDEDWSDSFALKFFGSVRLTRAAWPHLKKSGGTVVFISGVGGRTPGAQFAAGGSVNAALLSLTKSLAEAGIRDGIQVNAVNPGAIRTDRLKLRLASTMKDEGIDLQTAEDRFVRESNVTKIGEPEDVANLVAFVVGPEGRFLQGSLIDVDGGATKTI